MVRVARRLDKLMGGFRDSAINTPVLLGATRSGQSLKVQEWLHFRRPSHDPVSITKNTSGWCLGDYKLNGESL